MIRVSACWFNFRTRKRRCRSCRVFNVQNEVYTWRVLEKNGLSSVSKLSWETLSVTSRRGAPTSRRQISSLCHVATWISHVATSFEHSSVTSRRQIVKPTVTSRRVFSRRDVILHKPLSRRDVIPHVATWIEPTLYHVRDVA